MKYIVSIAMMAMSFILIDLRLFRTRKSIFNITPIEVEFDDRRLKRRRRKRKYKNRKYTRRKQFKEKNFKLKGSHAKDHRYSNQRMLRRMFFNS